MALPEVDLGASRTEGTSDAMRMGMIGAAAVAACARGASAEPRSRCWSRVGCTRPGSTAASTRSCGTDSRPRCGRPSAAWATSASFAGRAVSRLGPERGALDERVDDAVAVPGVPAHGVVRHVAPPDADRVEPGPDGAGDGPRASGRRRTAAASRPLSRPARRAAPRARRRGARPRPLVRQPEHQHLRLEAGDVPGCPGSPPRPPAAHQLVAPVQRAQLGARESSRPAVRSRSTACRPVSAPARWARPAVIRPTRRSSVAEGSDRIHQTSSPRSTVTA